ncbi:hypothetical protein [Citreimonas salinaria]|uniref:Uncharacterized protein n=1 Tax=Citreimonas salinaria TaxID=321339 RepID=A0A1H3MHQ6_9RHOB|nr:hypothetical protein [Citreimonas salinaria]SDY75709.1 hypothetical protein SAMN05444340_11711 [Citreimonas salinaria]
MTRQNQPHTSRRFDPSEPGDRNNGPETDASAAPQIHHDTDDGPSEGESLLGWVFRRVLEQDQAMQEKEQAKWLN